MSDTRDLNYIEKKIQTDNIKRSILWNQRICGKKRIDKTSNKIKRWSKEDSDIINFVTYTINEIFITTLNM